MIGFIDTYTLTQFGTTDNCSAIAILHSLQFTVVHALEFSLFISRILATDLSQSHFHLALNIDFLKAWHFIWNVFR
jgi:hypothetical protein